MKGFAALALVSVAMLETPTVFTVAERPLEWDELSEETFDPRWMLPAAPPEGQPNLLAAMEQLAALRFGLVAQDGSRIDTLGDLLVASRGMDLESRSAWWNGLVAQRSELFEEWVSQLYWLTYDDHLLGDDWDPGGEHARDGILEGQQWGLGDESGAPWSELSGDLNLNQAAVWIDADLAAIKQVENDYASYPDHVGADYEAIYPLENTAWRGRDDVRGEFSGLRLYFRCDLPFPFSDYECDLHMLNRRDARGRLVTDIYSTSRDFHWLAGRDVFLPLFTSGGEPAGHLLVRVYGFDLRGVPDRDRHRLSALRASLGNLKRLAQALPTEAETETAPDAIPSYAIRGVR